MNFCIIHVFIQVFQDKLSLKLNTELKTSVITAIKSGFCHVGREYKPNERIATALTLEANLGMRISDILQLHYCDIIKDSDRYRLNISEIKTGKERAFTVPEEIISYIDEYRTRNHMTEQQRLSLWGIQKEMQYFSEITNLHQI